MIDYVSPAVNRVQWDAINEAQREGTVRGNVNPNYSSPSSGKVRKTTTSNTQRIGLSYSPTSALKRAVVREYINSLPTNNPDTSRAIAENFESGKYDYGQIYRSIIQGSRLRENDTADAFSAYLILGYRIVNNLQKDKAIAAPMAQGVRAQIAPMLTANSQLAVPGVSARIGEQMKLQAAIAYVGWQDAIKENNLPSYQQKFANLLKTQYGMDLTLVRLTNRGFVQK